jgi:cellulose synthase/poly-beta-1,6-N-acetylglucosamine synthase-like glycosyltransferase
MAYNEDANIAFLLESLLRQRGTAFTLKKIFVVASGCTDGTVGIVESFVRSNEKVKLMIQEKREGKATAINLFLSQEEGDVVILASGDTIPEEDTIENLVRPFQDPAVGMTGARPVPVNSCDTFMGFTTNLYWRLHHELAMNHPKLGELIAFRNIVREIPADTAVDEASIEAVIAEAGLRVCYAPEAVIHNKGPETVGDFLKQRRRIVAGHLHLKATRNYTVSSKKFSNLVGLSKALFNGAGWNVKIFVWTCGAVCLEVLGRLLGAYDYHIKKKNPFNWDISKTTKDLKNDPSHS